VFMKMFFTVLGLLVLSQYTGCSPALRNETASAQAVPAASAADVNHNSSSAVKELARPEQPDRDESESNNEKYKVIPDAFKGIDFKNRSYPYEFSRGKSVAVPLKNGEHEYDFEDDRGWFSFSEAYYIDLTGDGSPEAIVMLWHVSCGASCDGGAALIYVYAVQKNRLKQLWQYETGSLGYGDGLKSFAVKDRKIIIELFGRFFDKTKEPRANFKFDAKGYTRLTFAFNGRSFVEEKREKFLTPERDVNNYSPETRIDE